MLAVMFLDIDGTVSPLTTDTDLAEDVQFLRPGAGSGLMYPYRPAVVEAIRGLHESGVEIRFLTDWEPAALSVWSSVGLGPYVACRPVEGRRRWWKTNVVAAHLEANPTDRVVWADDQLTASRLRGLDRDRLLVIAPKASIGLTAAHLRRVHSHLSSRIAGVDATR